MDKPLNDFVSNEKRSFKWHLGKTLASSLSGFIVGIIVSIIFFFSVFNLTLK
jgi:acid phosphatase family membrane protein YuiD